MISPRTTTIAEEFAKWENGMANWPAGHTESEAFTAGYLRGFDHARKTALDALAASLTKATPPEA
jgi:hypothetical protein